MKDVEIWLKEGKVLTSQHGKKVAQQWLDCWNMFTTIWLEVYSNQKSKAVKLPEGSYLYQGQGNLMLKVAGD